MTGCKFTSAEVLHERTTYRSQLLFPDKEAIAFREIQP